MFLILNKDEFLKSYYISALTKLIKSFRSICSIEDYTNEVPNANYLVLVENNNVIGFLRFYQFTKGHAIKYKYPLKYRKYHSVSSVIIDKKYRNKGYGKKIFSKLFKITSKVILDTYIDWTPAVKLYLSVGFKIVDSYKLNDNYIVILVH